MSVQHPVVFLSFPRSGCACITKVLRCTGMNIPTATPALTKLYDDFSKDVLGLATPNTLYGSVADSQFQGALNRGAFQGDLKAAIESDFGDSERGSLFGFAEPRNILFANAILAVYPQATLILIIRHPADCANSIKSVTPDGAVDFSKLLTAWVSAHETIYPHLTCKRMIVFRTQRMIHDPALAPTYLRSLGRQGLQPFVGYDPSDEHINSCCSIIMPEDWHHRENTWSGSQAEKLWLMYALDAVEKMP